jgi:predicted amidophosphoribosyltransferase
MHGGWHPAVIGCSHVYTGKAGPATIQLHRTNRRITCADCFDNWETLKYYCPACFLKKLEKYYPSVAQKVKEEQWFQED